MVYKHLILVHILADNGNANLVFSAGGDLWMCQLESSGYRKSSDSQI